VSGQKTEQPTSKKLRDARKRGEVAFSKEIVSSALILAFFALFAATLPTLVQRFGALLLLPVPLLDTDVQDASNQLIDAYVHEMIAILAPFFMVAVVGTIAACTLQFGLLLSLESAKPSLKKFNPGSYFKKTFAVQNVVEFLKSNLKIMVLTFLIFILLRDSMRAIVLAPTCGLECLREVMGKLLFNMAVWSAGPFIVVAAADFGFQKWNFNKKNMMSKDEVKREYKESEGDPQIKGMRKQLHQQMLAEGAVDRSRKATVLITNPTHVAVAVFYERDNTPLPVVTAIGTDLVAQRMIEAAVAAGVPVMRNVDLARSLLEEASIDQYIPSNLIEPFAEVLRSLQDLAGTG
jgi:type III secretion protein U